MDPQMSLNRAYCVPPTARVHHANVRRDSIAAAKQAIDDLLWLRGNVWGSTSTTSACDFRGVAKLGFSWQGDDVIAFSGAESLARVLCRLLEQPGSQQSSCLAA